MPRKIEISHRTIVFTVIFLLFLWLLYLIRDVIFQFFVAVLIMAILDPFVTKLEKFKIPRVISILLTYIFLSALVMLTVAGVVPPLVEQSTILANSIPDFLDQIGASGEYGQQILSEILSYVGTVPGKLGKLSLDLLSNLISVLTVLIFAFYLLLSRSKLDKNTEAFFGEKASNEINKILGILENRLGGWVIGQASLMLLVGVISYIGLVLLGIPFALPLAILAGLFEIVPYVGPVLAAIPAIIIALGISPIMALAVGALAFLVQQLENYIFVPKVMEKTVGISPIVTLLALAVGFKLAGVVGIIISVPAAITLQTISKEYLHSRSK